MTGLLFFDINHRHLQPYDQGFHFPSEGGILLFIISDILPD
jgi:hypothetical protein